MIEDSVLNAALVEVHCDENVSGACLEVEGRSIANHLPFSESKTQRLCATVNEMCTGYHSVGRDIDEYLFCYDKAAVLVFAESQTRLILLSSPQANFDQLSKIGRQFLVNHKGLLQQLAPPSARRVEVEEEKPAAPVEISVVTLTPINGKLPHEIRAEAAAAAAAAASAQTTTELPLPTAIVSSACANQNTEGWNGFREKLHALLNRVMGSGQSTRLVDRVIAEYGFSHDRPPDRGCFRNIAEDLLDHIQNRSRRRSLQSSFDELLRQERL